MPRQTPTPEPFAGTHCPPQMLAAWATEIGIANGDHTDCLGS